MKIKKTTRHGGVRIKVDGEINYDYAGEFAEILMESIPAKKPLLEIDLSDCNFMCSNALGTLAAALMIARSRGGDLKLAGASKNVLKLLDLTNLKDIIHSI
jgi:anti-sigma B factor antagonist